jgi:hypothetical protein
LLRQQVPEAVAWMRRPAEQNPCNAPIFLCLGRALAHAGQLKETGTVIERLPELHPIGQVAAAASAHASGRF